MVVTLMLKVPVVVLTFLLVGVLRNVVHLLDCIINLLLKPREAKHLLFALFNLLVDGFKVVDLLIELIVSWYRTDSLPLLTPCLSEECLFSLVGIQRNKDVTSCCLLRIHDEVCCDHCEFTEGGRQCCSLVSYF
jgi:hypothetical protein